MKNNKIYKRFLIGASCLFLLTLTVINLSESFFNTSKSGEVKGVFEDLSQNKFANLSPLEAQKLIEQKKDDQNFVILDVRNQQETQAGYIQNSVNLDFHSSDFEQKLDNLDKSKTYLVYCQSGFRSQKTLQKMKQKDFLQAYNLNGGILAWEYEDLPVEK